MLAKAEGNIQLFFCSYSEGLSNFLLFTFVVSRSKTTVEYFLQAKDSIDV